MKINMKFGIVLFAALLISVTTIAQVDAVRQKNYNLKKGIALEGYDPGSYFVCIAASLHGPGAPA